MAEFSEIVGKTVKEIRHERNVDNGEEFVNFEFTDGSWYVMYHSQDCCESVELDEIIGSALHEFAGETILFAEVASNSDDSAKDECDSHTWTFYKFASMRCNVTLRWYGTSNGYYSERVEFIRKREATK